MAEEKKGLDRVAELRREYHGDGLHQKDLAASPFDQFRKWFSQAQEAELLEPNAMSLATSSRSGRIGIRTVLLKAFDDRGLVFFTNYESAKARQLEENPQAGLLFAWLPLERQVSISGRVEKVSLAESLAYFTSRPMGSRLGAWVSEQSKIISSRSLLEAKFAEMKAKFANGEVPLPSFWGGYRVIPESMEFWQGAPSRLHDRFLYVKEADGFWKIDRLSP